MNKDRIPIIAAKLPKCATGIHGLDAITGGGLPRGRPTLICGGAGCGKTLFGLEFLVRGMQDFNEHGVFVSFEERAVDLTANVASLGFDLDSLIAKKSLMIDQVEIDRGEITETGEYNLDGLFIRLAAAIDAVGARRVVLDTIETLFSALENTQIIRSEMHRLFSWIKDKGITAIVTAERGEGTLTRHGLEEYVSDCVIVLDQRITEQVATRRLRIAKYRGSAHGSNEYPFMIDTDGISVLPITSIELNHSVSSELVSSGIPRLDAMLGGSGYFRGGSLMVSGTAGAGKTSIAAHFADAACRRGEHCAYFAFEESPEQIIRNMRSLGLDLGAWVGAGLLHFAASRPASFGLEVHLTSMIKLIDKIKPRVIVIDPISSFTTGGTELDAKSMVMRLIDLMKSREITAMLTSLTTAGHASEQTEIGISSLIDTWVMLRNIEQAGERTRALSIVKSRGRKHSNQARELLLTDQGVMLADVFIGPDGILTGSARAAQEAADRAAAAALESEIARKAAAMMRRRKAVETRIAEMQDDLAAETEEVRIDIKARTSAANELRAARATQALERETGDGVQNDG